MARIAEAFWTQSSGWRRRKVLIDEERWEHFKSTRNPSSGDGGDRPPQVIRPEGGGKLPGLLGGERPQPA